MTDAGAFTFRRGQFPALLAALPLGVRRVLLTGARPGAGSTEAFWRWAMPKRLPDGWAPDRGGHYRENANAPILKFVRRTPAGDEPVEVHRAATWFGDGDHSPEHVRAAWHLLAGLVARHFDGGVLLATPATTGRDLWARTIPADRPWPVLAGELQTLIQTTSGQGRIEFFPPAADELPGLAELDGRFMYSALIRELPCGEPVHDRGAQFCGYQRGRYLVEFAVPDGWAHVGLLPVMSAGGGWEYPRRPGQRGRAWIDGDELRLALLHRWPVTIRERLLWPDRGDPLRTWVDRLRRIVAGGADLEMAALIEAAVRNVVLHTLGAFHARPHAVTCTGPIGCDLPAGASRVRLDGGQMVWQEQRAPAWPDMAHPEWAAAVWARCRVRLLDGPAAYGARAGALHVEPDALVALRTDALYLTRDPGWADDGRTAGRFRLKSWRPGPLPAPRTVSQLLALRAASVAATGPQGARADQMTGEPAQGRKSASRRRS